MGDNLHMAVSLGMVNSLHMAGPHTVNSLHMASPHTVNSLHMASPHTVNSPLVDRVNSLGGRVVVWMDMQNRR